MATITNRYFKSINLQRISSFLSERRNALLVILALALLVRLIGISNPIADHHSWRQADTAAVARNYYANNYRLFYPQVDYGGPVGYVEMEFPIYSFIVALIYWPFGTHEFLGRLISILFSLAALFYLFKLVEGFYGYKAASWAAAFYALLPMSIYFGRTVMPESILQFCVIAGMYYFIRWIDEEKIGHFFLSALLISLAISIKPTSIYISLPLFYLGWWKFKGRVFIQPRLYLYIILVFAISVPWYYHAHQLYLNGGVSFGLWNSASHRLGTWKTLIDYTYWAFILYAVIKLLALSGLVFMILGMMEKVKNRKEYVFHLWIAAVVVYFFVVEKGNRIHDHYQLPFLPPALALAGKFLSAHFSREHVTKLRQRTVVALLLISLIALPPLLNYMLFQRLRDHYFYIEVGRGVDQVIDEDALLVFSHRSSNPALLYFSKRKGWYVWPGDIDRRLPEFISRGADYFLIFKGDVNSSKQNELAKNYEIVKSTETYLILDLRRKPQQ